MDFKLQLYRQKERFKRSIHRFTNGYCTVLLYHRVIDLEYDPQGLSVSVTNFEAQLTLLKKTHVFLTINEFCDLLISKRKFPKNSLLITFDDGYADNYYNALPILEKLNLQAVFFIATKNIGKKDLFWWDELDLIFSKIKEHNFSIDNLLIKYDLKTVDHLYNFYLSNCKNASSLFYRNNLLNEMRSIISIENELKSNYTFMDLKELNLLKQSNSAVIGAHTVNHLSLGHLPHENQKDEIESSVRALEKLLDIKIDHFSYPYGEKHNYNTDTISLCRDLGLKSAAANYCDYVSNKTDIYAYPRFVVRNDSPAVLLNKISGLL